MSETATTTDVIVKTKTQERTRTRKVPPYNVIIENDDHHSEGFVVEVLQKALGYSAQRSFQLMLLAHTSGQSVVWTGSKEVAELKLDQIQSFHEIRERDGAKLGPVGCRIEPAPGG